MNYIQLTIQVQSEKQDELVAQLAILEAVGFEQTDTELLVYFEEDNFSSYDVNELLQDFVFHISTVAEKNWNEAWEQGFEPVVLPGFCAVRAHFHQSIKNVRHEIIITPKMSFGTGHHATTFMMMDQMKTLEFSGKKVFDFGTGTGILAILAEKLGADSVTAVDYDSWSISNARENLEQNNCRRIELFQMSAVPPNKNFDLILANINRNVILEHLPELKKACGTGGKILLSGLIPEDENVVIAAAAEQTLQVLQKAEKSNWISLLLGHINENRLI